MILYVFIFYLLLSSHMHAVWRTLSEKNPFSNSLEIKLFCDFFRKDNSCRWRFQQKLKSSLVTTKPTFKHKNSFKLQANLQLLTGLDALLAHQNERPQKRGVEKDAMLRQWSGEVVCGGVWSWKKSAQNWDVMRITQGGFQQSHSIHTIVYLPGTLWWPLLWLEVGPCFEGLTFKNRGNLAGL